LYEVSLVLPHRTCAARRTLSVIVITLSCFASSVFAQSPTFARTDYPFLGNDHNVGDFNGDGKIDLVGMGLRSARIMLGNGDGTFQPFLESAAASAGQVQALASGDFNRDGVLDLMVTINDPDIGLAFLAGRGDGTFNPPVAFANSSRLDAPAIAAVDVNSDSNLDVVIGHQIACFTAPCIVGRTITVMLGNGNGTFQAPSEIQVGAGTAAIAVGDFNRDGNQDLGLASDSSRVFILLGAGNGTFVQQTLTLVPEGNIGMDNTDIDVGDLNGDTIDDLIVAMSLNGSKTVVLIGNGNGTFQAPRFIQEPGIRVPQYQAIADYNGDGRLDLALTLGFGSDGLMEIRNGNGDGTFGPNVMYLVPPPLSSIGGLKIHATDFNNDGKPDLSLTWGGASSGLATLRNTTGLTPPPRPSAPTLVAPADGATVAQPLTLDWNNVANATSYEIQIDNSSTIAAPFVTNLTVSASQATVSGLPAQRLWWRVRARNSAGVFGPFSSARRFTPQGVSTPASLASVSVSPTNVSGSTSATGTVTLTAAAPSGGALVSLTSGNTAVASVPSAVTVPAGSSTATFAVSTSAVATSTSVTLSAVYGGITRTTTLTVNPPGQPATVPLTVSATGRSGERVTSNPAGISVSVGSTGSASFTLGASITLSVTNGRDAIWSGACSSGGDKRRTCTFTLNGAASVSANVQ
jgi:hypothetical protein